MSRRCASPIALKTSNVVEERATAALYSDIGICQPAQSLPPAPAAALRRSAARARPACPQSNGGRPSWAPSTRLRLVAERRVQLRHAHLVAGRVAESDVDAVRLLLRLLLELDAAGLQLLVRRADVVGREEQTG